MRPTARTKSGSKKLQPSAILEREARDMEEKLKQLKKQMANEKEKRNDVMQTSGSRWATASTSKPIKNYSGKLIDEKNNFLQKTGQKLGGTANLGNTKNSTIQKKSNLLMTQQPPLYKRPNSNNKNNAALPNKNNFMDQNQKSNNQQQKQMQNDGFQNQQQNQQEQQSIENNLQKHLQIQKGKEKDHIQFLQDINLPQYLTKFEENGFEDLDTIIELNTELLNDMMIPAGHQIKIMKKVDKLRQENNLAPQKEHILNQYKSSNYNKKSTQPPAKRTDLIELEYEEPKTEKHSIAIGDDPNQKKNQSKFDGDFNEKESHQSFLEALMEWRGQKPSNQQTEPEPEIQQRSKEKKKSVKFQQDVVDNEGKSEYRKPGGKLYKPSQNSSGQQAGDSNTQISQQTKKQQQSNQKGGLFFMGGESNYDNDNYTTNHDSDTQTANMEIPVIHDKTPCWQCYKLFSQSVALSHSNKLFCTQNCLDQFLKEQNVKCKNEQCNNYQQKDKCIFENGNYYCSEKCQNIHANQQNSSQESIKSQDQNVSQNNQNIEQSQNNNKQVDNNIKENPTQNQKPFELNSDQIAQLERPFSQVIKEDSQNSTNASFLLNLEGEKQTEIKQNGIFSLAELENKYKQINMTKSQIKQPQIQENIIQNASKVQQNEQEEEDQDIITDSLDMR